MQHKACFTAVHRSLCDILGEPEDGALFGGVPCIFGGDFAQILPVVQKGSRSDIVRANIQCSHVWPYLGITSIPSKRSTCTNQSLPKRRIWRKSCNSTKVKPSLSRRHDLSGRDGFSFTAVQAQGRRTSLSRCASLSSLTTYITASSSAPPVLSCLAEAERAVSDREHASTR